jgi:hypothetical protein
VFVVRLLEIHRFFLLLFTSPNLQHIPSLFFLTLFFFFLTYSPCIILLLLLFKTRGVAYSKLTPVLVAAVQELNLKVESLLEENKSLKERVALLESASTNSANSLLLEQMSAMMARITALENKESL